MHIRPFNKFTSLKGFQIFPKYQFGVQSWIQIKIEKMYFKLFQLLIILNYVFIWHFAYLHEKPQ